MLTIAAYVIGLALVVADLWEPVPVADAVADAVLSVFAPRNVPETARMLAPGGSWLLVTPNPGHLRRVRAEEDEAAADTGPLPEVDPSRRR